MTEPLIVIEENGTLAGRLGAAKPTAAASPKELRAALDKHVHGAIFVARPTPMMQWLVDLDVLDKMPHRLLVLGHTKAAERAFLNALFEDVVAPNDDIVLLKTDDLIEVLNSSKRANLFIGGAVVPSAKSVVLIRGSLDSLVIPFHWFSARPAGPKPDFIDFEIIDSGHTLRLGKYEAAADAILYELDSQFRRQERKRRIREDRSLGGAIRRLRLQRGVARNDFPGISAKELARIERGEVKHPHAETLRVIAEKLRVRLEELETY
jgi:hypothetical protein